MGLLLGEIDDGSVRWLELPLGMAIELGAERLEIDLRGLSFLDGAVMKALCRASLALPFGSGAIQVWVQPRVEALFRRVRLDQLMTIRSSGDEAKDGMLRRLPWLGAPPAGE